MEESAGHVEALTTSKEIVPTKERAKENSEDLKEEENGEKEKEMVEKGMTDPNQRGDQVHHRAGTRLPEVNQKEVGAETHTLVERVIIPATILTVIRLGRVEKEARMITMRLL